MTIDLASLKKEIQDRLILKEETELTFSNALSVSYTDVLFETLDERRQPDANHSYIATMFGQQGCLLGGSRILTDKGWKAVEKINVGEMVLSVSPSYVKEWKRVSFKHEYPNNKHLLRILLKGGIELNVTPNHRLYVGRCRFGGVKKRASELIVGDKLDLVLCGCAASIIHISFGGCPCLVYDITVEDNHNYVLEGVLSSNSGKCIDDNELIYIKRKGIGWFIGRMGDIVKGDCVWSSGYNYVSNFSKVLNVWKRKECGFNIITKRSSSFICSENHKHIIKRNDKIVEVATKDLCNGDIFLSYKYHMDSYDIDTGDNNYALGFVTGAYLADGCINYNVLSKPFFIITKAEGKIKEKIQYYFNKVFGFRLNEYITAGKSALTLNSCYVLVVKYFESFGQRSNKFFVPYQFSFTFLKGLLDGYINCDSEINVNYYKNNKKVEICLMTNSFRLCHALKTTIAMFGFCVSYRKRILKSGKWKGNEYHRLNFGRTEGERFLNFISLYGNKKESLEEIKKVCSLITNSDRIKVFYNMFENPLIKVEHTGNVYNMVDIETEYGNYFLANGVLTHNSYAGISLCGYLDPKFNIDKIYFDIERLVDERRNLHRGTAVIVDEMMRGFGIDSNRVNIQLQAIKEQLRKRQIHMFYSSPTLKDEYLTSMYIFETMFIDKPNQLSYHAYKTNQLMCLGYVAVPHPLKFVSRDLLKAYEEKKDVHLSEVLESPADIIEERAEKIVQDPYFLNAEKIYINARGFVPHRILVQIIEKLYPDFKGSVVVMELADRVKANKEISGEWQIFGSVSRKKSKPSLSSLPSVSVPDDESVSDVSVASVAAVRAMPRSLPSFYRKVFK